MRRERDDRLRDELARLRADRVGELGAFRGGAVRADQHAVAARRGRALHDEPFEVREHVRALRVVGAVERLDVRQHRLLAQIVADHRRHVRVDRLVVGDARADRVRERHVAGAVRVVEPGDAERRSRRGSTAGR